MEEMTNEELRKSCREKCIFYNIKHARLAVSNASPIVEQEVSELNDLISRMTYTYAGLSSVNLVNKRTGEHVDTNFAIVKVVEEFNSEEDLKKSGRITSRYEKEHMSIGDTGKIKVSSYIQVPLYNEGEPKATITVDPGIFLVARYKKYVRYSYSYLAKKVFDSKGKPFDDLDFISSNTNYPMLGSDSMVSLSDMVEDSIQKRLEEVKGNDLQSER